MHVVGQVVGHEGDEREHHGKAAAHAQNGEDQIAIFQNVPVADRNRALGRRRGTIMAEHPHQGDHHQETRQGRDREYPMPVGQYF